MAENKTQPTAMSVESFLDAVEPPQRRADGKAVCAMMERITGEPPVMWGPSIVGFGSYAYPCGPREERAPRSGFSPRKASMVIYLVPDYAGKQEQLALLGKHTTGKSCLYIKKLADVDEAVLEEMVRDSLAHMDQKYPRG